MSFQCFHRLWWAYNRGIIRSILFIQFVYISLLDNDPYKLFQIITQVTSIEKSKCDSKTENIWRTWKPSNTALKTSYVRSYSHCEMKTDFFKKSSSNTPWNHEFETHIQWQTVKHIDLIFEHFKWLTDSSNPSFER